MSALIRCLLGFCIFLLADLTIAWIVDHQGQTYFEVDFFAFKIVLDTQHHTNPRTVATIHGPSPRTYDRRGNT